MSKGQAREAIMVADCGRGQTRATLLEVVDGVCRFVAQGVSPSSVEPPYDDLQVGLRAAVGALEEAAVRRVTTEAQLLTPQDDSGDGIDAVLATMAACPPLRITLLSAGASALVAALVDICRQSPVTVLPGLTLDAATRADDTLHEQVALLGQQQTDVLILVAGDTQAGALPHLLDVAEDIVAAFPLTATPPAILVIGEERFQATAVQAFGKGYEFGWLVVPANAAGNAELAAAIGQELADLANRRAGNTLAGFGSLEARTAAPPIARARALELVNRFMALQFACEVVTLDLEDGLTCCWARGAEHRALSEPALDLALGAANLLTGLTLTNVLQWLPFAYSEDELHGWILNRALRPFTVPTTRKDRQIEVALVRELARVAATELGGEQGLTPDLVVGGAFFARWPNPATAFLALVDGVRPRPASGLTQLALDREGLLPAIGALGVLEPGRAAEVFEHDGLLDLGAHLAIECPPNETVRGQLTRADGHTEEFSVPGGALLRLPLRAGERAASVRIEAGGRAAVGRGNPGAGAVLEGPAAPHGGPVGLVIATRGHALALPRNDQERIARLTAWSAALGDD
jgi:hypothetical protein